MPQLIHPGRLMAAPKGGGAAGPGVSTGVIVADRFQIATGTVSIPANTTCYREHFASSEGDITNIQTIDINFYWSTSTFNITGTGASYTIKRYIEYPAGVFHQVKWAGATSVTVANGSFKQSDVVISSVTGLPLVIPKGSMFAERTVNLNATATVMPNIILPATATAIGVNDGKDAADKGNSGTIAPQASANMFGAFCMTGDIAKANARRFVAFGDSINWGQGDITGCGAQQSTGFIARGLAAAGYPYLKIACSGASAFNAAADFPTHATWAQVLALLGSYELISEMGGGDIRLGSSQATLFADLQTCWGQFPGATRIWAHTYTPRTDSTDSWATVANQTMKSDGNWANSNNINDAIRAGTLPGIYRVIDASDWGSSAHNSGLWSAPPAPATDGVHPTSTRAATLATNYPAAIVP